VKNETAKCLKFGKISIPFLQIEGRAALPRGLDKQQLVPALKICG
jgi:hypothetical protein